MLFQEKHNLRCIRLPCNFKASNDTDRNQWINMQNIPAFKHENQAVDWEM